MQDSAESRGIYAALRRARMMILRADILLMDLQKRDMDEAVASFYLIAVLGRSVTLTLQNIRTHDRARFNAWWLGMETAMRNDPLFRLMNDLRNVYLKEGGMGVGFIGAEVTGWGRVLYRSRVFLSGPFAERAGSLGNHPLDELGRVYLRGVHSIVDATATRYLGRPLREESYRAFVTQPPDLQ
jgi:hypothetical protein